MPLDLDAEHYCIQSKRIEKMDRKLDDIHDQFQVDGSIGVMSGRLARLTTLAENGTKKEPPVDKIVYWVIAGLVAIIAALVGVNLPV